MGASLKVNNNTVTNQTLSKYNSFIIVIRLQEDSFDILSTII